MKAQEIREKFLSFWKSKQHEIVASAPLLTQNDPTLFFVNSGMAPFKELFLGNKKIDFPRIADTQKCLRVSGKHNDLEDVGVDTYHHTFFEMLGNWSFGDYFKKEAITWAFELLTKVFQIDPQRMYVTIFEGDALENLEQDTEAKAIWTQFLPQERILLGSKKDNFWEMGETGPCGPCSEIHIDMRSEKERASIPGKDLVNADHPQVIEIWNLVFMQFQRKADGSLSALAQKHIDTGMGFERLCMVLQNKTSTYDTDVFLPLLEKLENIFNVKYEGKDSPKDIALRVIVDHIRTLAFTIADGQLPSNTGAGYVIRRILRRAVRYGYSFLGAKKPFLSEVFLVLQKQMGDFFPELYKQSTLIFQTLLQEESSFFQTLEKGITRFENYMLNHPQKIKGDFAFELYDTFGFPIDLTILLAKEKKIPVDLEGFEQALQEQKNRSRAATQSKFGDFMSVGIAQKEPVFSGYHTHQLTTYLLFYRQIEQQEEIFYELLLQDTPFYPQGGGQVGDTGILFFDGEPILVLDTHKQNNQILHKVAHLPKDLTAAVFACIDAQKRLASSQNHSATHLLHWALREILGNQVEQRGSLVNAEGLRFDFSYPQKLTQEQIAAVETKANEAIFYAWNLEEFEDISLEQAKKEGAIALFGEKYAEKVRMIVFGSSKELCGGTHVQNTAFIKKIKIVKETAVAAGIRRIEALSGESLIKYYQEKENQMIALENQLKQKNISKAVTDLLSKNALLEKKIQVLITEKTKNFETEILEKALEKNNFYFYFGAIENLDANAAKTFILQFQKKYPNYFLALWQNEDQEGKLYLSLDKKYFTSDFDLTILSQKLQGFFPLKGGGQPSFMQFSTVFWTEPELEKLKNIIL